MVVCQIFVIKKYDSHVGSPGCSATILQGLLLLQEVPYHRSHNFSQWERKFSKYRLLGVSLCSYEVDSGQLQMHTWKHQIQFGKVKYDPASSGQALL